MTMTPSLTRKEARARYEKRWAARWPPIEEYNRRWLVVAEGAAWCDGRDELNLDDVEVADRIMADEKKAAFAARD